jgi:predicted ATPase
LVPQLLKYGDQIGGQFLEGDPFGQGFLERLARMSEGVRDKRLEKIEQALALVVPNFEKLRFVRDGITGRPHMEARYVHHRPNSGWQREEQFSDGTLRLIALLWILQEGNSLLLLEEPELSLNNGVVAQIPILFQRISLDRKRRARQILVSTHSEALLSNKGIDPKNVLILEPAREGTKIRTVNEKEERLLQDGFSVADVLMPEVTLATVGQLSHF